MRFSHILIVAALLALSLIGNVGIAESEKTNQATSPSRLWQDVDAKTRANISAQTQKQQQPQRSLKLDVELLQTILRRAPQESLGSKKDEHITLDLPAPDAGFMRFNIEDSPIMEKALANRYPEIKTYRGQGIDDPTAITRFDWTPFGFHGIILSTRGTILIEPESRGDLVNYVAYFQDQSTGSFECDVDTASQEAAIAEQKQLKQLKQSGGIGANVVSGNALRTYRLAVAATAEYTQTYGSGTVSGALAAITTTMNLVNAIYEREVAVRMVLIANEDSIIFTDTSTDGYTSDVTTSLISQNESKLDSVIGPGNYDIGHVFDGRTLSGGFSWQGVGSIGSVCRDGVKGRGVSIMRSIQPFNLFAVYNVAHEMGHQFGATHTFNATTATCGPERSPSTAYEPATGSTIMGYRFACGAESLNSTDTYFHLASLEQITNYTTVGNGTCGSSQPTGNNTPTVDAGASYNIPSQTPFQLTATASDPDGDNLTYSWEEFDLGTASPPHTDDGTRPLFRSFNPTPVPSRTFPRLLDILSGIPTFGETLPTTTRTMNFKVTVRDNRSNGGAASSDDMQLNVSSAAGPFTVNKPSSWTTSSSQTVMWDVANTNNAPVSCTNVKISLSVDGGLNYPITLANSTPNDGSETITVPGTPFPEGRIKVEAVGNVFFNISQPFPINGAANSTPAISSFSPGAGGSGTAVTITGTNFISPTAVRFNGVDASFTTNSTTEIIATVPNGATSGPITVTTSQGTATSAASFVVPGAVIVSGHIADGGNNPISGVTITFTKNFQGTITTTTASTDAQGNYSSGDVGCQNGVLVTPSKVGYTFSPLAISFTSSGCIPATNTANFTGTAAPPTLLVEEGTNRLAAVDSVTLVRGPFALTNSYNLSSDQRTRILFFTTDLGFSQTTQPDLNTLSVQIAGNSYAVEAVGPNATTGGSYIVFRLPDLSPGTYPLSIRVRGVNSTNSPDLIIVASAGNSGSGLASNFDRLQFTDLLFPLVDLLF